VYEFHPLAQKSLPLEDYLTMNRVWLFKTSLAWRNLIRNRKRFVAAIAAVTFAVFLMFSQLGFQNAFLDSSVAYLQILDADLIVSSQRRNVAIVAQTFDRSKLYPLEGIPGVATTTPFYITIGNWKNKQTRKGVPIRVVAFNPSRPALQLDSVQSTATALQEEDTLLIDRRSRDEYGFQRLKTGDFGELSNRQFQIVGEFEIGSDFVSFGNIIMSDLNFLRTFANTPSGSKNELRSTLEDVDLGLIKVTPGADIDRVVAQLKTILPIDLSLHTKKAFVQREKDFFNNSSPIGFIFSLGTLIGFVVGVVVVYNIIYTDIQDNLPQYATLRAMGYSSFYLLKTIFLQSVIIALVGFFPGIISSVLAYKLISNATGLLLQMKLNVSIVVFALTVGMCVVSGFIASRRLLKLDPAEIY